VEVSKCIQTLWIGCMMFYSQMDRENSIASPYWSNQGSWMDKLQGLRLDLVKIEFGQGVLQGDTGGLV